MIMFSYFASATSCLVVAGAVFVAFFVSFLATFAMIKPMWS